IKNILPNAEIIVAENGELAVAKYIGEQPDLVFMDIQMPLLNGYEASLLIRQQKTPHHIPIIALTAGTVIDERERCLAAGMDDYVSKPIRKDTIESIIRQWVINRISD